MHKIFELKEMDQEKLVELASELKIKNIKKMSKDDLVYAILDTEAAAKAAHEAEKEAEKEAARIAAGLRYTLSRLLFLRFPSSSLFLFLLPGSTIFCPPSLFLLFGHGLVLLCTIIAPWTSAPSLLLFWSTALLLL